MVIVQTMVYLYLTMKKVQDSLNQNKIREFAMVGSLTVLALVLSTKANSSVCFYLLTPAEKSYEEDSKWFYMAFFLGFWMMAVAPLIYYFHHEMNHICSSLMKQLLEVKMKKVNHLVWVTYLRIVIRTLFNIGLIVFNDGF
jgi:hypothetical protein